MEKVHRKVIDAMSCGLPTGEVILKSDDGERRLSQEEQETANFAVLGVMVGNHSGRPKPQSL